MNPDIAPYLEVLDEHTVIGPNFLGFRIKVSSDLHQADSLLEICSNLYEAGLCVLVTVLHGANPALGSTVEIEHLTAVLEEEDVLHVHITPENLAAMVREMQELDLVQDYQDAAIERYGRELREEDLQRLLAAGEAKD